MNINKEFCMVTKTKFQDITKTKFQDIKEELNRNYYKNNDWREPQTNTYNSKLDALKNAVDELLTLLDRAVY